MSETHLHFEVLSLASVTGSPVRRYAFKVFKTDGNAAEETPWKAIWLPYSWDKLPNHDLAFLAHADVWTDGITITYDNPQFNSCLLHEEFNANAINEAENPYVPLEVKPQSKSRFNRDSERDEMWEQFSKVEKALKANFLRMGHKEGTAFTLTCEKCNENEFNMPQKAGGYPLGIFTGLMWGFALDHYTCAFPDSDEEE